MIGEKKRRKKGNEEASGGGEASWMMTFSDLSTLLLTFFVLLLSMSSLNERAFRSAFVNFTDASGIVFFKNRQPKRVSLEMTVQDLVKTLESTHLAEFKELSELTSREFVREELELVVSGNAVMFRRFDTIDGFSFIFGEMLMFDANSARLNPRVLPILDRLSRFLNESKYRAFIDGHTDNIPIRAGPYADNQELSLARAMAVLKYMRDHGKVSAKKLAVVGYGSSHPIDSNATSKGRASNRRVEIIFRKLVE